MQLVLSCILGWVGVHTILVGRMTTPSAGAPTPPFGLEGPLGLMAAPQKKHALLHSGSGAQAVVRSTCSCKENFVRRKPRAEYLYEFDLYKDNGPAEWPVAHPSGC